MCGHPENYVIKHVLKSKRSKKAEDERIRSTLISSARGLGAKLEIVSVCMKSKRKTIKNLRSIEKGNKPIYAVGLLYEGCSLFK